ncbi:unnamed protein product [Adineta ricciae]|uniref:SAP domain-containing protein n=3 Tax=Adineta ricciae TaxID=249248 RepID=A0A814KNZ9_ADIRI|nr:unnamed protein product [Adineta ricciae]
MFERLSTTSPYICDVSLGPIEQANRMALAPTKASIPYLDFKESFPRLQQNRTPLKLLAPDEVPMNASIATTTTTDTNHSRQTSLQPVWYTEQTIVDDINDQQQQQQSNSARSSTNHRHDLTRSTLPTIESNSPEIEDEIIEKEPLSAKPSLMRKSSTFTIEQQSSINSPSSLNESEKENNFDVMITSTQQESKKSICHPNEPSEESFRALEHLLGLGSANTNLTMTTMTQDSPKSNHESLSLTIVTPTELINQTGASLHLSYAPAGGGGSLPSSQNILVMPTIESITDPSINSTIPPPFDVDNSEIEEPSSACGTVINPDTSKCTEDSFHFTDEDDEERIETPKDNTNTEDDDDDDDDQNDFSLELNDFPNNSKDTVNESVVQAPPMITIRAPTCADVAYRALIKTRAGGRISQPIKTQSPLAKSDPIKVTVRSSVPVSSPTRTSRVLRSSTRRMSTDPVAEKSTTQEINESNVTSDDKCFANEDQTTDDYPRIELVEVVSVSEDDEVEQEQAAGITLNLTETKEIDSSSTTSAEEADCSASSSCASFISPQVNIGTPADAKKPVLSREFTYDSPALRKTRSLQHRSILLNRPSSSRSNQSLIPPIPEQQVTNSSEEEQDLSTYSIPLSESKILLTTLSTNPTTMSEAPPMILQKSLAGSASPSPNPTPVITIRQSEHLSSALSPRRSINPLHSSTPSTRSKSLQMVSLGEQEQLSTTVPQHLQIDLTAEDVEMLDNEQQVDIPVYQVAEEGIQTSPIQPPRRIDVSAQTTPSLNPLSRRCFQAMEQQTTPIAKRSSSSASCQTTPIAIQIKQTSPMAPHVPSVVSSVIIEEEREQQQQQQQVTPLHSKAIVHLRRNVRFQFTPSTDARLAAKEKLEEEQKRQVKLDIVIDPINPIPSDNEREEDTEDESIRAKKKISTSKKKKVSAPSTKTDDSSEETNESPVLRTTRHQHLIESQNDEQTTKSNEPDVPSTAHTKKKSSKRSGRKEKPSSPVKELSEVEPEIIVVSPSPPPTAKRAGRKRANPKTSTTSPPETISPPEQAMKRAKTTTKTNETKPLAPVPSPEVPSTRARSKTPVMTNVNLKSASPIESTEPSSSTRKTKKGPSESSPVETTSKRKHPTSASKKSKRRLHSVEQDEGLNTADEEETVHTLAVPIEIASIELSQEEREKIEGLTVAELKTRLTAHHETLPKGARKADLVALLIKIETNLLTEQKEAEAKSVVSTAIEPPTRKTRRKK